ncbi:MAG TPA: bile acid:sodium symporter family protein [Pseudonocardiaceae bacterium]|jgi:sodium/bile acid cotransporter 7|nr:bile acid:sodium symporter family protein [Pseudonocardiaceae bacterium]
MEGVRKFLDPFILSILAAVGLGCVLPVRGVGAVFGAHATTVAIGLLFFLYGARLSPAAAWAGVKHWRLHLTVFAATFVLFPLLAIAAHLLVPWVLTPVMYTGIVLLCAAPSTVQSSIALTSIANGNVAAAICSASFSSLVGIVLTPALVAVLARGQSVLSAASIGEIVLQLLVPFLAGQLARRWIVDWLTSHRTVTTIVDRGSILLVVYTAFSAGIVAGSWHQLNLPRFAGLLGVDAVLLAIALGSTWFIGGRLGFDRPDRITIMFCGSKKSLSAGISMAGVLFAGHAVSLIVLPLMLFHQIQLMAGAGLARRLSRSGLAATTPRTNLQLT